jgi:hypothetical protein
MNKIVHRRDTCRACNSKELDLVFQLNPTPIGDAYVQKEKREIVQENYPIDLFICKKCGLAQITDIIDPAVLYGEYIYVTGSSFGLSDHFNGYAKGVISKCRIQKGAFIIDIGSNDGTLLSAFQNQGMNVLGIEPAPHIAEWANNNGVKTVNTFLTTEAARKIKEENGPAKLITSNNVFANIDDLKTWVDSVEILLAQDGIYVFESFYLTDLIENVVFDFLYHEHVSAFSVKPIKLLFESIGLELITVEHIRTKGGSLRYYVQRPNGPMVNDGVVAEYLAEEEAKGIYSKQIYIDYQERIQELKAQTLTFLIQAKKENKSVAGFGASITATTLIYHFEIGEYLDYLVDENPAKVGLYSPGLHIPVFSPEVLIEKKPDYVFILAWRFAEPIINKNQNYIANGGKFIIPIPEFKILG